MSECATASGMAGSCVVLASKQKSVSYIFYYIILNIAGVLLSILFELYAG